MEMAVNWVRWVDYLLVVGTSLQVYPAAALMHYLKPGTPAWYIDPNPELHRVPTGFQCICATATEGIKQLKF